MRTIRGGFKQREDAAAGEIAQPRRIHHPFPGQDLALMNKSRLRPAADARSYACGCGREAGLGVPGDRQGPARSNDDS